MVELGEAKGFLYRLLNYTPRMGRIPREDFFTEALAGYLNAVPSALTAILCSPKLPGKLVEVITETGGKLEFSTQAPWGAFGRPDIVVSTSNRPVLVIECKLGASFTETVLRTPREENNGDDSSELVAQIPKYCSKVLKEGWKAKVVVFSLVSREAEVLPTIKGEHRDVYAGNILWSDVHKALCHLRTAETSVPEVLTELLIDLMECMGMKEKEPLGLDCVAPYYIYKEALATLAVLLENVGHNLMEDFECKLLGGKSASWYVHRDLAFGDDLCLGLYIEFEDAGKDVPVWPMLYVEPDYPKASDALNHLDHEVHDPKWQGRVVYPEAEEVVKMLEATSWQEQVTVTTQIFKDWLNRLADRGVVARR
jgi:hypothetical protein